MEPRKRTIIIDKVCDTDAEKCAVKARVKAGDPFSLDNTPDGIVSAGLSTSRFHLSSSGESNERVTKPYKSAVWVEMGMIELTSRSLTKAPRQHPRERGRHCQTVVLPPMVVP